jgi:hypothetical protein
MKSIFVLLFLVAINIGNATETNMISEKIIPKKVVVKEIEKETKEEVNPIKEFTKSYRGSRIDDEYFALLDKYCSDEALKTVVAISVAESGMGRDVNRESNFFGWFKNGNENYDPDKGTMAKEICNGIEKSYLGIGNDMGKVKDYVGYISEDWLYNYRWAYNKLN